MGMSSESSHAQSSQAVSFVSLGIQLWAEPALGFLNMQVLGKKCVLVH